MLNVVCIWSPSKVYTADYVNILAAAVKRHLTVPYRFCCLTSIASWDGAELKLLDKEIKVGLSQSGWSGWWLTIELFKLEQFEGPVLYLDLDTFIVDNIDFLAEPYEGIIMGLDDFYRPGTFMNAVMLFNPCKELNAVYEYLLDPAHFAAAKKLRFGDMQYTEERLKVAGIKPEVMDTRWPGKIISYKKHFMKKASLSGVSIVCCHGTPKPHEIHHPLLKPHWRL